MTCREEPIRMSDEDQAEQAVLALLLDVHPAQLSTDEVVRELTDRPGEFEPRDRVNNALRDLTAAGLVHRHGAFVFASRAAVRFEDLRM
jgi:Fe2+ or Zn2+ uptake regulation protein